jgi:sugar-specific transcriptional regulator TrmB
VNISIQQSTNWQKRLQDEFENLEILEGEDLKVYLEVLKSQKDLMGNEIVEKFMNLKRTHIYAILNRLQKDGWIVLTNPGTRPALYRAISPNNNLQKIINNQQQKLSQLGELQDFVNKKVVPFLSSEQQYGGRVSNTFTIPTTDDLYHQIKDHLKNAKTRVMLHASYDLFFELKDPILNAITTIFDICNKKGIRLRDEGRRDRFALIVTGKEKDSNLSQDLPYRLRIIIDPNPSQTDIIIIDNCVFINNFNTGFGLSLRINDESVASRYAILLSHIFIEKQIELYGNTNINVLGIHTAKEEIIKNTIQSLFKLGWKVLPEHTNTNDKFDELGLAAPGSERAFFRLSGLKIIPFTNDKSKNEQILELFNEHYSGALAYIQRLRKQLKLHGKKTQRNILGHDCYLYEIKYELKKEWTHFLGYVPETDLSPEKGKGFVIASFNYKDKAAMSIWAITPKNVWTILEIILEQF